MNSDQCDRYVQLALFSVNLKMNDLSPVLKKTVRKAIERPEAVLLVRLRHQSSGKHLAVANLHAAWTQLKYPALQTLQVKLVHLDLCHHKICSFRLVCQ